MPLWQPKKLVSKLSHLLMFPWPLYFWGFFLSVFGDLFSYLCVLLHNVIHCKNNATCFELKLHENIPIWILFVAFSLLPIVKKIYLFRFSIKHSKISFCKKPDFYIPYLSDPDYMISWINMMHKPFFRQIAKLKKTVMPRIFFLIMCKLGKIYPWYLYPR